jgi:hypothetical protein
MATALSHFFLGFFLLDNEDPLVDLGREHLEKALVQLKALEHPDATLLASFVLILQADPDPGMHALKMDAAQRARIVKEAVDMQVLLRVIVLTIH